MRLDPEDQDYLRPEVSAFLGRLGAPEARRFYEPLGPAVEAGEIPEDLLDPLGRVLELSLGSGRLRKLHGPIAERNAIRLFQRTPRGLAIRQSVDEANRALSGLRDQVIRSIDFAPRGPGAFSMTIETDRCRAQFILDEAGIRGRGVELDL